MDWQVRAEIDKQRKKTHLNRLDGRANDDPLVQGENDKKRKRTGPNRLDGPANDDPLVQGKNDKKRKKTNVPAQTDQHYLQATPRTSVQDYGISVVARLTYEE